MGGFWGFLGKCLGDDLGVLSGFAVYFWVFWVFGFFGCFERFFEFSDNLGLKRLFGAFSRDFQVFPGLRISF